MSFFTRKVSYLKSFVLKFNWVSSSSYWENSINNFQLVKHAQKLRFIMHNCWEVIWNFCLFPLQIVLLIRHDWRWRIMMFLKRNRFFCNPHIEDENSIFYWYMERIIKYMWRLKLLYVKKIIETSIFLKAQNLQNYRSENFLP